MCTALTLACCLHHVCPFGRAQQQRAVDADGASHLLSGQRHAQRAGLPDNAAACCMACLDHCSLADGHSPSHSLLHLRLYSRWTSRTTPSTPGSSSRSWRQGGAAGWRQRFTASAASADLCPACSHYYTLVPLANTAAHSMHASWPTLVSSATASAAVPALHPCSS